MREVYSANPSLLIWKCWKMLETLFCPLSVSFLATVNWYGGFPTTALNFILLISSFSFVGIELYTKMLEEAIRNIKGLPREEEPDDKPSLINVNTHIKTNYVEEESVRIEIHKLINTIENHYHYLVLN